MKTGAVARGHVHVAPLFGIGRRAQRQDVGVHTVCAEAPGVTRQVRLGIYRFDAAPLARYSERCRPNEPHIVELGRANAVGHHTRFAHGTWPRQLRRRSIDENGTLANALVGARALVRLIARQVDGPYLDGVRAEVLKGQAIDTRLRRRLGACDAPRRHCPHEGTRQRQRGRRGGEPLRDDVEMDGLGRHTSRLGSPVRDELVGACLVGSNCDTEWSKGQLRPMGISCASL